MGWNKGLRYASSNSVRVAATIHEAWQAQGKFWISCPMDRFQWKRILERCMSTRDSISRPYRKINSQIKLFIFYKCRIILYRWQKYCNRTNDVHSCLFVWGFTPTPQISMLTVGSISFFSFVWGRSAQPWNWGVGYLSHLATCETVAIFPLPTVIDGPSFYLPFLYNVFDVYHVQTRRQNLEEKGYHSTIRSF